LITPETSSHPTPHQSQAPSPNDDESDLEEDDEDLGLTGNAAMQVVHEQKGHQSVSESAMMAFKA